MAGWGPTYPDGRPYPAPSDVDHKKNAEEAAKKSNEYWTRWGSGQWFESKVGNKKDWDFKKSKNCPCYTNYGNWHYGYTGSAAGFSPDVLKKSAGAVQQGGAPGTGTNWGKIPSGFGIGGSGAYGDQLQDQHWIDRGIQDFDRDFPNGIP